MKNFISVGDETFEEKLEKNWKSYSKYIWIAVVVGIGGVYGNGQMKEMTVEKSQLSADSLYSVVNSKAPVEAYKLEKDTMKPSDRLMAIYKIAKGQDLNEGDGIYVKEEIKSLAQSDKENRNKYLSVLANRKVNDGEYKSAIDILKGKTIMTAIDKMIVGDLSVELGEINNALEYYQGSLMLGKTTEFKKIIEGRISRLNTQVKNK